MQISRRLGQYQGVECFMKIVDRKMYEEVDMEVAIYKRLRDLQGYAIPKFIGCGNLCGVVDILILEDYRGACTSQDVEDVLTPLRQLHAPGVLHGDIRRQNVVCRAPREFVWIDFGKSEIHNVTEAEMKDEIEKARRIFSAV